MVEMRVLHNVISVLNYTGRLVWPPQILAAILLLLLGFLSTLLHRTPLRMVVLLGNTRFKKHMPFLMN
jgi:hypothetical protein